MKLFTSQRANFEFLQLKTSELKKDLRIITN
jgi:hypothetical protein